MIRLNKAGEFEDVSVIRKIISILKTNFNGSWSTWKEVDTSSRAHLWCQFKERYQWEVKYTDGVIYEVWESGIKERYDDMMYKERFKAVQRAKADNVNASMDGDMSLINPYKSSWIKSNHWEDMIDRVWMKGKWKRQSESGKRNRNKREYDSIFKHSCGSIKISHHAGRMENELKRLPIVVEVYKKHIFLKRLKKAFQSTLRPKLEKSWLDSG